MDAIITPPPPKTYPPPQKTFYIAREVQLRVFQNGWSDMAQLVGKNDCIVLIPVAISGSAGASGSAETSVSAEAWVQETAGQRKTTLKLSKNSENMIAGRCSIWMPEQTKVVCVVLCISKNKG